MKLGAHVSAAGGVGKAPGNAEAIGAECMQVFTRNQNRWSSKPIAAREAEKYRRELGSRVDRHADIGEGELGLEPFRMLMGDDRWAGLPGCLETPGGPDAWKVQIAELAALRGASP